MLPRTPKHTKHTQTQPNTPKCTQTHLFLVCESVIHFVLDLGEGGDGSGQNGSGVFQGRFNLRPSLQTNRRVVFCGPANVWLG